MKISMKMKCISFLVSSMIFPFYTLLAQNAQNGYRQENKTLDAINAYSEYNNYYTFDNRYKGMKGSPFVLTSWSKGDIEMTDSKIIKSVPVKIDVYNNIILALKGNGDSIMLDNQRIKSVVLHDARLENGDYTVVNRLFKRIPAASSLKMGDVYFEEILNAKGLLFVKRNYKVLKKASGASAYNSGNTYDEMINKEEYFICKDSNIIPVKLNIKSFEKAIAGLASDIRLYASQHLNLRSEQDFTTMLMEVSKGSK